MAAKRVGWGQGLSETQIGVLLPQRVKDKIKKIADQRMMSVSALCREIIIERLEKLD